MEVPLLIVPVSLVFEDLKAPGEQRRQGWHCPRDLVQLGQEEPGDILMQMRERNKQDPVF